MPIDSFSLFNCWSNWEFSCYNFSITGVWSDGWKEEGLDPLMDVEGISTLEDDVGIWWVGVTKFLWERIGSDLTSLSGSKSFVENSLILLWGISISEDNWIGSEVLVGFTLGFPLVLQVLLRKHSPLNWLDPLLFVGTEGKSCWNEPCNFLGLGSTCLEGNGELSTWFLVFLPNEAVGESTVFLAFWSDRDIVWAGGFGVFGEWGLDGVTTPKSTDLLLVLTVRWGFENW
jgi:hypothetical protein